MLPEYASSLGLSSSVPEMTVCLYLLFVPWPFRSQTILTSYTSPEESTPAVQESLVVLENDTPDHGIRISQIAPIRSSTTGTSFRRGNIFQRLHIVNQEDLVDVCSVAKEVWCDRIVTF